MGEEIRFERLGQIGLITLNRPKALNALTISMIVRMQEQLQSWKHDNSVQAIVLRAASSHAFCAGGDVRWLYEAGKVSDEEQLNFFWHEYRLNYFIHQLGKPYVAFIDGMVMGGGVGISMHGSHPVASERFVFAMPETGIGLFPDIGASFLLNRCPGSLGVYLGLTGNRLGPQDAMKAGLVTQVIASEKMPEVLQDLIDMDLSIDAFGFVTACLQQYAMSDEVVEKSLINPLIDVCFSKRSIERIRDILETSEGNWVKGVDNILHFKSPLSLKVTLAQLLKTKGLSLAECLKIDYDLVGHFMQGPDFYEGIRALLIDKDKNPQWKPARMDLVSEKMVASYFERLGPELELIE